MNGVFARGLCGVVGRAKERANASEGFDNAPGTVSTWKVVACHRQQVVALAVFADYRGVDRLSDFGRADK